MAFLESLLFLIFGFVLAVGVVFFICLVYGLNYSEKKNREEKAQVLALRNIPSECLPKCYQSEFCPLGAAQYSQNQTAVLNMLAYMSTQLNGNDNSSN